MNIKIVLSFFNLLLWKIYDVIGCQKICNVKSMSFKTRILKFFVSDLII